MKLIAYIEINVFASVILLLIFFNISKKPVKHLLNQKLYLGLLFSNILILVFDTAMWVVDGKTGYFAKESNLFFSAGYYILSPVPCMLWSLYADFQINRDEKHTKKLLAPFLIPICINAVLSVLSISNGYMFYIDRNNIYHRGKLFLIMALICYIYLIYTFIQLITTKSNMKKNEYYTLLVFGLPPSIGGLIQTIFYGVSLIWVCMSISLLLIFFNIQNNQLYTDYLTGLNNRRQLDYYLTECMEGNPRGSLLAGIMIDINSFKEINDLYGHTMGDQALENTGIILRQSFREGDFIARYGGDEFFVILTVNEKADLIKAVDRLRKNTELFNEHRITPYSINLSIGYDIYDYNSKVTAQQFIKHLDCLMYEDKKNNVSIIT